MSYVYRYVHPDNPWLYVGRTENIHNRIRNHNSAAYDNIDRQYSEMLNESAVYYIELSNKAQSIAVEAYLIDKYKPMLNKSLVYENSGVTIDMSLPNWIKLEALEQKINDSSDEIKNLRAQITSLKKEKELLENECTELNNKLLAYKEKFFNLDPSVNVLCKFEEAYNRLLIKKENNERFNVSEQEVNSIVNYNWEFIEEYFEAFPDSDVVFTLKVFNVNGEKVKYEVKKDGLYIDDEFEIGRKAIFFDITSIAPITKVTYYTSSLLAAKMLLAYYEGEIAKTEAVTSNIAELVADRDNISKNDMWYNKDKSLKVWNNDYLGLHIRNDEESYYEKNWEPEKELTDEVLQKLTEKYKDEILYIYHGPYEYNDLLLKVNDLKEKYKI